MFGKACGVRVEAKGRSNLRVNLQLTCVRNHALPTNNRLHAIGPGKHPPRSACFA